MQSQALTPPRLWLPFSHLLTFFIISTYFRRLLCLSSLSLFSSGICSHLLIWSSSCLPSLLHLRSSLSPLPLENPLYKATFVYLLACSLASTCLILFNRYRIRLDLMWNCLSLAVVVGVVVDTLLGKCAELLLYCVRCCTAGHVRLVDGVCSACR